MTDPVHIASLLVQSMPDRCAAVEEEISQIPKAEIAHRDGQGRLIVILETASEAEIVKALIDIQLFTGVVSASLVYHQMDEDLASEAC
ncbi:chaperone NapD [Breoghania sp.]|uniref:chaperone NapD n=1 Tax=Breoghania sp. TaxID=2065378 RepID=UPI002AA82CB3|nr:chaperone NapD [Breoghania sp.]